MESSGGEWSPRGSPATTIIRHNDCSPYSEMGDQPFTSGADARPIRVGIVGAGHVGATTAFASLMTGLVAELVLIDQDSSRANGEAMDLNHAVPFTHPTRVWAGEYADLAGVLVTVIAAGVGQRPGETRLDLRQRNADVFRDIVPKVVEQNPAGILLIATNPVDVLSYLAWKLSGARTMAWIRVACMPISSGNTETARSRCGPWPISPA